MRLVLHMLRACCVHCVLHVARLDSMSSDAPAAPRAVGSPWRPLASSACLLLRSHYLIRRGGPVRPAERAVLQVRRLLRQLFILAHACMRMPPRHNWRHRPPHRSEFAVDFPFAGGAYTYISASMGEFFGWVSAFTFRVLLQ
jgi:hypothetical protein